MDQSDGHSRKPHRKRAKTLACAPYNPAPMCVATAAIRVAVRHPITCACRAWLSLLTLAAA
eukprot:8736065-Pyramimonas_sp.AAC.1